MELAWSIAMGLTLGAAFTEARQTFGESRLATVAIGGAGAVWPFVRDIVATVHLTLWENDDPIDAVGEGAASWSVLGSAWDLPKMTASPTPVSPPAKLTGGSKVA
jgi:hypothetical protein